MSSKKQRKTLRGLQGGFVVQKVNFLELNDK